MHRGHAAVSLDAIIYGARVGAAGCQNSASHHPHVARVSITSAMRVEVRDKLFFANKQDTLFVFVLAIDSDPRIGKKEDSVKHF